MSNIDPTKPTQGHALTQDVRDNFQAAADEIDAIVVVNGQQTNSIGQNISDIDALEAGQVVQDGRISQNESDIVDINTAQGVQDGRISQNETDIGTNASAIGSNDTDIANLQADKVNKSGDTMTGQLKGITPVAPADLTTKGYVDAQAGGGGGAVTGAITMWPLAVAPVDHFICDGQSLDTTAEADLFAVLGYTYGGAGASFNLPDYRGAFMRGTDNGAGVDPDAASRTDRGDGTTGDNVGTQQGDQNASHQHSTAGDHQHAGAGDHGHAANGDHGHPGEGDHLHPAAGDHGHTASGNHQHATAGDHNHLLQTFQSGANDPQVTYAQIDDDDTETPTNLTTPTTTNGAHQHAAAGSHTHPNAGNHQHTGAGAHTHANAGSHTHANAGNHQHAATGDHQHGASGGNESRPVNVSINFIIKN